MCLLCKQVYRFTLCYAAAGTTEANCWIASRARRRRRAQLYVHMYGFNKIIIWIGSEIVYTSGTRGYAYVQF